MIIDHIGYAFFPQEIWLRAIGRLSMPLFCYGITKGFQRCNESSEFNYKRLNKYFERLLFFTLISQIPYSFMTSSLNWNIGMTWLCSLFLLKMFDGTYGIKVKIASLVLAATINYIFRFDYGMYGCFMCLLIYHFYTKKKEPIKLTLSLILLNLLRILGGYSIGSILLQTISIFAVLLLFFLEKYDSKIKLPKKTYYIAYPLHMLVIVFIKLFIN